MFFVLKVGIELREMPVYLSVYLYFLQHFWPPVIYLFIYFCQGEVPFSIQSISCYGISSSEWGTIGKNNINMQMMKEMEKLNSSIYGISYYGLTPEKGHICINPRKWLTKRTAGPGQETTYHLQCLGKTMSA